MRFAMFDSPYITLVVSWMLAILIHTGLARRLSLLKDRTKMLDEQYRKMQDEVEAASSAAAEIRRGISSNTSQVKSLRNKAFSMVQEVRAFSPDDESVRGVVEKLNAQLNWGGNADDAHGEEEAGDARQSPDIESVQAEAVAAAKLAVS
jgi:chromosome segregation ATPase